MKYLEDFPITGVFLGFFIASCAFAYCSLLWKGIFVAVALLALFIVLFVKLPLRQSLRKLILCLLSSVAAAAILSALFLNVLFDYYDSQDGKTDTVTLSITECEYSLSYTARYRAKVLQSELLPKGTQILLNSSMTALEEGTLVSGEIVYASLSDSSTASFDSVSYYLPKRIMLTAEETSLTETGKTETFSLSSFFRSIQGSLSDKLLAHSGMDAGGLASAVLLGDRDMLSDSVERDFRRLGITHLLVVSGTHFSVLVSFAEYTMRKLRMDRRVRVCLNILLILAIMLLTGFTPSVVRAGIMHLLAQCSLLLYQRPNTLHSFALAGALMVLLNPYSAMDCGLQLSFAATYSCILYQRYRSAFFRYLRKRGISRRNWLGRVIMSTLEVTLMTSMVTVATLPLCWLYFGEISLISIPLNILFIPLITILMYISGLYLLLYPFRIFIPLTAFLLRAYCGFLETVAGYFAEWDWIMLPVNYSFSVYFLLPLALLLLLFPFVARKGKQRILLSVASLCLVFFSVIGICQYIDRQNTYLSYLPEKKNDGFVLKSDGKALICEISDASKSYLNNLTNEVRSLHSCEIEAIYILHYHNKHVQILEQLAQREILRSVILATPMDEREEGIYSSLIEIADLYDVAVVTVEEGVPYVFGNAAITLLDRSYISRSSHPITAVQIEVEDESTVIASCSFNQGDAVIAEALKEADFPILGRHSPVYKKAFTLELTNAKALLIGDEAYSYNSTPSHPCAVYRQPEALRVKISPSGTDYTVTEKAEEESQ